MKACFLAVGVIFLILIAGLVCAVAAGTKAHHPTGVLIDSISNRFCKTRVWSSGMTKLR